MALVSYGDTPQVVREFTTDPQAIADGVDGLTPVGAAAMWDGIYAGAQTLENSPELQPNIVVVSASSDSASVTPASRVNGLTTSLGTSVFAVGIEPGAPAAALEQLVGDSGGRYLSTTDVDRTMKREVLPSIDGQYDVVFATEVKAGEVVDLEASIGDLTTAVSYIDGGIVAGNLELAPLETTSGGGGGILHSTMGKLPPVLAGPRWPSSLGAYAYDPRVLEGRGRSGRGASGVLRGVRRRGRWRGRRERRRHQRLHPAGRRPHRGDRRSPGSPGQDRRGPGAGGHAAAGRRGPVLLRRLHPRGVRPALPPVGQPHVDPGGRRRPRRPSRPWS